ncbi:MAG: glycosyltransferase [Eubacterium sp.]|nr:glycosyltransferase [Eubacterium sp.]
MKVCHITSAHPQEDIRIFHKECVTLAEGGHRTYQVSCGTLYKKNGVRMAGFGDAASGRLGRMLGTARKAYRMALKVDAEVYHFHDPELLPYGLKLKRKGKKVIFDSHEDVPGQILDKTWIPAPLRKIISGLYRKYETHVVKHLDAVVAATPHIAEKFEGRAKKVVVVNNFPNLDDIRFQKAPFAGREALVCYAGGIDENRGESIMKHAMEGVPGELVIAGDHPEEKQENVTYVGRLDRDGVNDLYGRSVAGLCILKPIENYYYSQPIKMYEYMAAGLPFICSDFPGWRKVAEESGGGILVDPTDNDGIRSAITGLLTDREKAERMGRKGRDYVVANCTWENEAKTLLRLYEEL